MNGKTICAFAAALLLGTPLAFCQAANEAQPPKQKVEVAFVIDSTGSMGGLIEGAKKKIWSIANGIVARKPAPAVRFALISYRDKGDEYITKTYDLSDDIDTVFKNLQEIKAAGGGDSPESVNRALNEAVEKLSWSSGKDTVKTIFVVGDCPPHMDYQDDVKYPVSCQEAAKKGIVINTVQCGSYKETTPIWQEMAKLAEGSYIALEQSGGMQALATPYDEELSKLGSEVGRTVVAYGSERQQSEAKSKVSNAAAAPASVAADRAMFNVRAEGKKAIQGDGDLVADSKAGAVKLESLKESELPEEMRKMNEEERKAYLEKQSAKRAELNKSIEALSAKRAEFMDKELKRLAAEVKGEAFDLKVQEMIDKQVKRQQAAKQ